MTRYWRLGSLLVGLVAVVGCSGDDGSPPDAGTGGEAGAQGGSPAGGAGGGPAVGGACGTACGAPGGAGGAAGAGIAGAAGGGAGTAGAGGSAGTAGGNDGSAGMAGREAGGAPAAGGAGGSIHLVILPPNTGVGGAAGGPAPVPGVLELLAGQLGGPGTLDGVGTNARLASALYVAYDEDDNRVFVNDGQLRSIDVDTRRVTSLGAISGNDLHYQRGGLYLVEGANTQLTQLSPSDGHVTATTVVQPLASDYAPLVSWPAGEAMFQVSDDGQLSRVETATGVVTRMPIAGFPSSVQALETVMTGPTTILISVAASFTATDPPPVTPRFNAILSVDVTTATATVTLMLSVDVVASAIDPEGHFASLSNGEAVSLDTSFPTSLVVSGMLAAGPHDSVLMLGQSALYLWERSSGSLTPWVGLDRPNSAENLGPGSGVTFAQGPLGLATHGNKAYGAGALRDGLAVIDLATGAVSSLIQPTAINAAAVWPAADGTLYFTKRSDCSLWQLSAAPNAAPTPLPSPPSDGCLVQPGFAFNNPLHNNWVSSALVQLGGSLVLTSNGLDMLEQLDLARKTSSLQYIDVDLLQRPFGGFIGLAAGSDGLLYAVDGQYMYRFDPSLQTATRFGPGGDSLAADKQGHLYTNDKDSVLRYDIATGQLRTVVGVPGSVGVSLGALPGSLNHPRGLAVTDAGDLLIGNTGEYTILRARLP